MPFFRSRISEKTFSWPILPKKKSWKNVNFLTLWNSCFYSLERGCFVLEYSKRDFSGLYCVKKKVWKMAIFEPQLSVNPLGKMSILSTFSTSSFYSLKRRFYVIQYHKRHFPALYCLKKKLKNRHFWTKTMC